MIDYIQELYEKTISADQETLAYVVRELLEIGVDQNTLVSCFLNDETLLEQFAYESLQLPTLRFLSVRSLVLRAIKSYHKDLS